MATYVTSLDSNARLAHFGTARLTLCGTLFMGRSRTSDTIPADRGMCDRCVTAALRQGKISGREAVRLLGHKPSAPPSRGGYPPREIAAVVALLHEGLDDKGIAARLGISLRGVTRRTAQGMREVGVTTRFQWGYALGSAER